MKTKRMSNYLKMILLLLAASGVQAQETYNLEPKAALAISGTSTLHDWEMTSNTSTGKLVATAKAGKLEKIASLAIEMPAESIKSGKKGMDKNAYKALKTAQYKNVKFDLKQAVKTGTGWNLTGTFTIAGVAKEVIIAVKETSTAGKFTLSGNYSFNLTDYKIDPPTAMMGTIKTGNAVKITFTVSFK